MTNNNNNPLEVYIRLLHAFQNYVINQNELIEHLELIKSKINNFSFELIVGKKLMTIDYVIKLFKEGIILNNTSEIDCLFETIDKYYNYIEDSKQYEVL